MKPIQEFIHKTVEVLAVVSSMLCVGFVYGIGFIVAVHFMRHYCHLGLM